MLLASVPTYLPASPHYSASSPAIPLLMPGYARQPHMPSLSLSYPVPVHHPSQLAPFCMLVTHHTYWAPPHGSATNARHPTRHLTTILLAPEAFLESVSFNTVCSSQYSNLLFMGLRGPRNPIHSTQCVHSLNCMVQHTVVSLCVVPS